MVSGREVVDQIGSVLGTYLFHLVCFCISLFILSVVVCPAYYGVLFLINVSYLILYIIFVIVGLISQSVCPISCDMSYIDLQDKMVL